MLTPPVRGESELGPESDAGAESESKRSFSTKAAEKRAKLADASWRVFLADLGVRVLVSVGVVVLVVIVLTLLARR